MAVGDTKETLSNIFDPGDIFGVRGGRNVSRANAALDEAMQAAEDAASQNNSLYSQYMNKVNQNYGNQAGQYDSRVKELEGMDVYNPGQFDDSKYNKTIEDFYSKAANQRVNKATNAITNSMANAGNMFSSDYTDALAAKQQALASEEWDKAFDKYNADRSRALQEFSTNANIGQQTYANMYNKNKDLLGISQNALDNTTNAFGSYVQGVANNNNMLAQNKATIAQQKAANQMAQNKSLLGKIFG